jgi:hypothetical protein
MKYLEHPYFGKLNTEGLDDYDILWEENIPYKNGTVSVGFWFCGKDDLSIERLDLFEKFLKDFDAVDEKVRKALKVYIEENFKYFSFYVEKLENIPDFVAEMQIKSIGLWYSIDEASTGEVIIDYMIHPEESYQVLAVKCSLEGKILAVDWEG